MGWGISAERASLAMSQVASPDRESFHIGMARLAYIEGAIDVGEFESNVAHVLAGGTLNAQGRIATPHVLGLTTVNEGRSKQDAVFYKPAGAYDVLPLDNLMG